MEMRTNKRSYWIQPMIVVGAILVAIGMANAVSSTAVTSGAFVATVGDSYVAFGRISALDSSTLGVLLPVGQAVDTTGRVSTSATISGRFEQPRLLSGAISTAGVHTGTVRNSSDTTGATSFTITLAGSDTGTGTASSGQAIGETSVQASLKTMVVVGDSPLVTAFGAGRTDVGRLRDNNGASLQDSGILSISASQAAATATVGGFGLINATGGIDTPLAVQITSAAPNVSADSRIFFLVYNQTRDTFITATSTQNAPNTTVAAGALHYAGNVRFETGINRLFVLWLGANSDSPGELKKSSYSTTVDSIAFYAGVVIISDTSTATGGVAGVNVGTTNDILTTTASITASSDTVAMTLTGLVGSDFTLVATPVSSAATQVVAADSATSNETHLQTPIFDFTIFNGVGTQVTNIAPGVLRLTLRVSGDDTKYVVTNGFRLLRISTTNGTWESFTGIGGVLLTPIGGSGVLVGCNAILLTVDVNTLPGDLVGVGTISGTSTASSGGGGGCVLDKTLGGSIFSGSFSAIRSARDLALSTGVGRAFVSLYYAAGLLLAIGLFGFVAKKVRA